MQSNSSGYSIVKLCNVKKWKHPQWYGDPVKFVDDEKFPLCPPCLSGEDRIYDVVISGMKETRT